MKNMMRKGMLMTTMVTEKQSNLQRVFFLGSSWAWEEDEYWNWTDLVSELDHQWRNLLSTGSWLMNIDCTSLLCVCIYMRGVYQCMRVKGWGRVGHWGGVSFESIIIILHLQPYNYTQSPLYSQNCIFDISHLINVLVLHLHPPFS